MRIPFIGQSYAARSINMDCERTINFYLEVSQSGANPSVPVALIGTPGLRRIAQLAIKPIQGAIVANGDLYVVCGGQLYKITTALVATLIGTINESLDAVFLAFNGTEIFIADGSNGYLYTLGGGIVTIGGGIVANPASATFQDGYFITHSANTSTFQISDIRNGISWDALDVAIIEGAPGNLLNQISSHRELWFFKENSIEVWVNTGAADFPFERSSNVFIEYGLAAKQAVAKGSNTVFWLGRSQEGNYMVLMASGYTPNRISTHAIEEMINGYDVIDDAIGYYYEDRGHGFFKLIFPTANATLVYDTATAAWHERASYNGSNLVRHRSNCHVFWDGMNVVGDYKNGKLYELDPMTYDEDGTALISIRRTQTLKADQRQQFFGQLTVDLEAGAGTQTGQGQDPQIALRWSDDSGHTWSNYYYRSMGLVGKYNYRPKWNRLGKARSRVWEISISDPVKRVILGATVDMMSGTT